MKGYVDAARAFFEQCVLEFWRTHPLGHPAPPGLRRAHELLNEYERGELGELEAALELVEIGRTLRWTKTV